MKINAEIEISWIDDNGDIDEIMNQKILDSVSEQILKKTKNLISDQVANAAKKVVTAKTEMMINSALENPITITKGWNNTISYNSVYDYIETEMESILKGKFKKADGQCDIDPFLSKLNSYIKSETDRLLKDTESIVKKRAAKAAQEEFANSELIKAINISLKKS